MLDAYAETVPAASTPRIPDGVAGRCHARFILLEELGRGAMGVVYGAYDPKLDRRIALKVLPECGEEALTEARALARLNHPHVVQVHDVGRCDGRTWLAMAYLDGPTLGEWQASAGPDDIIATYARLGEGLAAAHAAGLVHRDFKPDNVVFGGDGRPRIIDFGLASWRGDGTPGVWGTPGYIAPEVLQGAPATPAADQFALCSALYRALFGQPPYPGRTPLALAVAMSRAQLRRPAPSPDVPPWVVDAVLRGLAIDPDARWPSMHALVAELRRCPSSDAGLFAAERARFTRYIFLALAALLLVSGALGGDRAPTPGEALAWGLVWPALLAGIVWSSRGWIRASPLNRCLARVLVVAAAVGVVIRVLAWQMGLPTHQVLTFELAACAGISAMSVPVLGRWMGAVAVIEVLGALLAAQWPTQAPLIFLTVLLVLGVLAWRHVIRPAAQTARQPASSAISPAMASGTPTSSDKTAHDVPRAMLSV